MSRRYQELEEKARHDVDGAKSVLKRLGDDERVLIRAWLCKFFDDAGALYSPQIESHRRRTIALDAVTYWLVPSRRREHDRRRH